MGQRRIFYHDSLNHNKNEAMDAMRSVEALMQAVAASDFGAGFNFIQQGIGILLI
jgi:hypothetical protein